MKVISSQDLEVVICTQGAEIVSVKRQSEEYIWQGHAKYWGRQAPVLFPIVGRLVEDKFEFDGKEYSLNQHGFARDMMFNCIKEEKDLVSFEVQANEETKQKYPFNFKLTITYKVDGMNLSVEYKIENLDDETMYYSIGGHPGFNVDPAKKYTIEFQNTGNMYTLDGAYISGKESGIPEVVNFDKETFINGALIAEPSEEKKIVTIKEDGIKYVEMDYTEFKLLGVWTPEGQDAPFVCLEPWNGVADFKDKESNNLKDKEFIETLEANTIETMKYTITFN